MEKLYVIVRSDLAPGAQIAQSCHAVGAFALAHPETYRAWLTGQSNIVCLNAPDENELAHLLYEAECRGISLAMFREPDFGESLTAIALGDGASKLTSRLPLALRAPKLAA